MDYDGDGHLDLVSGCYDPGALYLFRGLGQGQFGKRETILDKSGKPILRKPGQSHPVESFGSWLALVDWDGSGRLSIILGGYDGSMHLRLNEGMRAKPAYSTTNVPILAGGKPLMVPGAHATPVVADWDGDGRWDLLSGSDNGGVYWYRNIGSKGKPEFAPAVVLVPPHKGNGYNEFVDAGEKPSPGIRSQIAVADWGDGKLSLLVGDFRTTMGPRPNLSSDERQRLRELRVKLAAADEALSASWQQLNKKMWEPFKDMPPEKVLTNEVQAQIRKRQTELAAEPGHKRVTEEREKLWEQVKPMLAKSAEKSAAGDYGTPHGHVWLYRRK